MRTAILVLAMIASSVAQQAEKTEPYEVKGVKLGSSLDEWKQRPAAAECREVVNKGDDYSCLELGATFAGASGKEIVSFYKQRLSSFYFVISAADYSGVRAALEQKFGKPASVESKTYQNGYGAKFQGEYVTWTNGISTIALEEMGSDKMHSTLMFGQLDILAEASKAKAKAKANDM